VIVEEKSAPDRSQSPSRIRRAGRALRRVLSHWRPILLTVLLLSATGFAAGYFYVVYRPDVQTDGAARHQVIQAASDGAVALLSYSPDTLTRDLNNAKSRVTDGYLPYYQQFAEKVVGISAQRGLVTTTAVVIKAAVAQMHPDSAVVLAFLRLKTMSKDKPEPVVTSSSLKVTLKRVNGSWLIDNLETTGGNRPS
jgi:Mce-associated membrane protein